MNKLRIKLNKIFSKNPDFVFYDYDNECVGKDLLKLILTLQKAQHKEIIELVKKRISDEITYQVKIGSKQASYKISVLYKIIKKLK